MADDQSSELVRELRKIRFTLFGILILLALNLAQVGYHHWAESHYRTPRMSQEFRDIHGELRAIHNELSDQLNPPLVVIPGGKLKAREANQAE